MQYLSFLILILGTAQGELRLDPLVVTKQGLVRGLKADDGDYSMFLGIPYATVDERNPFGVALPHSNFDGIFEAYDDSAICIQAEQFSNTIKGTLDCLRLNVYTPNSASSENKLPVIVWFYGGGFNVGDGARESHGPKYLVKHDVILVSINYRVGPYGFMCLGTPEVPGNQGIKDQYIALRWIKDNIGSFGGDGNKITLMGESAGSMSIEYHIFSKQDRLFNKLILQSGTILKPRGAIEVNTTVPFRIAAYLGFETDKLSDTLDFLSKTDPNLVVAASNALSLNSYLRPCVENKLDDNDSLLTEHPLNVNISKIKGIPILAGINNREGLMDDSLNPLSYKNSQFFHDKLAIMFNIDESFPEMVDIVKHFYVGDVMSEEIRTNLIDFQSDFLYNYPLQMVLEKYLENEAGEIYQYVFSYDGGKNYLKNFYNITLEGAAHADELGYLFYMPKYDKDPESVEDQLVIERMTTLWTNFAKYGNPTPETSNLLPVKWSPISNKNFTYLDIDNELTIRSRPFSRRMAFWKLLYKMYRDKLKGIERK